MYCVVIACFSFIFSFIECLRKMFLGCYIGYGEEYDEWKPVEDVVNVGDSCSDSESECDEFSQSADTKSLRYKLYSLYDELSFRIKSVLISNRKGDPICMVSVNFDTVYSGTSE